MLGELIAQVHAQSHGIYGAGRIHAELSIGRDSTVGRGQVELLM